MIVLLAVLGAAAWIGFEGSQDEADELFDARLATSARVLAALIATQPRPPAGPPIVVSFPAPLEAAAHDEAGPFGHHYETKIAFQVLDSQGRVLMRSASAPQTPYAPLAPGSACSATGACSRCARASSGCRPPSATRCATSSSVKLAWAAVAPLIAGIPLLLLLLIGLLVRYGLAPLAELARRIERRQPGSLAPIALARSTAEIEPVLAALNGLLERVQSAIARERRFTADAAHELRTPLAALKVHAQNAARASTEAERRASLERMMAGLERSIRLVEQMLALSRAAARAPAADPVSLRQVVEDALDDVLPALKERGVKMSLVSEPPMAELVVSGDRDKLTCLARNLLDNAARYAPPGSTCRSASPSAQARRR